AVFFVRPMRLPLRIQERKSSANTQKFGLPLHLFMTITDTHTHLYSEEFLADRTAMIARAINLGVKRFFVPSIDSSYAEPMYDLERQYPDNVYLMMGLHPTHVKPETFKAELTFVETELERRKFYAVGEIG